MTIFFASLWARLSGYVAAAGVILSVLVGAFLYGRSDGRESERAEQAKSNAKARTQSKEVENEINGLDDGAVDQRLSEWMRDSKR
jgi:cell division protein FtsB